MVIHVTLTCLIASAFILRWLHNISWSTIPKPKLIPFECFEFLLRSFVPSFVLFSQDVLSIATSTNDCPNEKTNKQVNVLTDIFDRSDAIRFHLSFLSSAESPSLRISRVLCYVSPQPDTSISELDRASSWQSAPNYCYPPSFDVPSFSGFFYEKQTFRVSCIWCFCMFM